MNRQDLIERVAVKLDDDKKAAKTVVDAVFEEITRSLVKDEKVQITGFGTFTKRVRPARKGRNPRTGEAVRVKKSATAAFSAGLTLKETVSGKRKLPRVSVAKKNTAAAAKSNATGKATARKSAPAKRVAAAKPAAKTGSRVKAAAATSSAKNTAVKPAAVKRAPGRKTASPKPAPARAARKSTAKAARSAR